MFRLFSCVATSVFGELEGDTLLQSKKWHDNPTEGPNFYADETTPDSPTWNPPDETTSDSPTWNPPEETTSDSPIGYNGCEGGPNCHGECCCPVGAWPGQHQGLWHCYPDSTRPPYYETTTGPPHHEDDCSVVVTDEDGCVSVVDHGHNERCTFNMQAVPLRVVQFDTEQCCDKLTVNGVEYSGRQGPQGVTPNGPLVWYSDHSVSGSQSHPGGYRDPGVYRGFKICPDPTWNPTDETTSDSPTWNPPEETTSDSPSGCEGGPICASEAECCCPASSWPGNHETFWRCYPDSTRPPYYETSPPPEEETTTGPPPHEEVWHVEATITKVTH